LVLLETEVIIFSGQFGPLISNFHLGPLSQTGGVCSVARIKGTFFFGQERGVNFSRFVQTSFMNSLLSEIFCF